MDEISIARSKEADEAPDLPMSGPARRRGRPAVLSRESVLQAAADVSAADPLNPLSVSTVARRLGVSSMAIYKYYPSREDLLQALSVHLMRDFRIAAGPDATALERIEGWLAGMRVLMLGNRQLINLLSWDQGNISQAWETHTAPIFEALEELGFAGDELAQTALWLFISGMSAIRFEVHARLWREARGPSDPPFLSHDADSPRKVIEHFQRDDDYHDHLFDFQLRRMLDALRLQAGLPSVGR